MSTVFPLLDSAPSISYGASSELRGGAITPDPHPPTPESTSRIYADLPDKTLAQLCVFHVPDKPLELQDPKNSASTSIPLNLTIKASAVEKGVWVLVLNLKCPFRKWASGPSITSQLELDSARYEVKCTRSQSMNLL
jgi:hypothetical protein